jgi:hypothetical protein
LMPLPELANHLGKVLLAGIIAGPIFPEIHCEQ